ncbi:ABC transporter permease subunit [Stieleria varia]|uniref:Binding-protein-dependent transport system inner membrane component n=1 Tax=Stieleria varia TaxID=2528005 RepID=A0A5C6B013_9BACT|nr:ABC transporter permease subunit [Stieleria varia]TWU05625.1 Binding-protein-dependent transport system inner membrane component [Stieleria varia]
MKRWPSRFALEILRFLALLVLVSLAASVLGMLVTDSSFLGFYRDLHRDRDGVSIGPQFYRAAMETVPILALAIVMIASGAMVLGRLEDHPMLGWIKVVVLSVSALPSFLLPFLPSLLSPDHAFQGMPSGGVWLPAVCLALGDCNLSTVSSRFRESLRSQHAMPHIQTLQTLGLSVWRFTWPQACVALLFSLTGRIPHLIGGVVALELLFNIPGIGITAYQSVSETPADLHWFFWICIFCVTLRSAFRWLGMLAHARWIPERIEHDMEEEDAQYDPIGNATTDVSQRTESTSILAAPVEADLDGQSHSALSSDLQSDIAVTTSSGTFLGNLVRNTLYYSRLRPANRFNMAYAGLASIVLAMLVMVCWMYGDVPPDGSFLDPGQEHWFGTDLAGLDVLSSIRTGMNQMIVPTLLAIACAASWTPCSLLSLHRWVRSRWIRRGVFLADQFCLLMAEFIESLPKLLVLLAGFSVMAGEVIDATILGVDFSINTMVIRLFVLIGLLHAPQVYQAVRDELESINHAVYVEASLMTRMTWRQMIFRMVLQNHCLPVLLIQCAAVIAGVLHYDAVLGLLGVRGRGVIFTWGSQLGMGMEAFMNWAPMDWFNRWILGIPFLYVWLGIVVFWLLVESLKTTVGGYVYRLR